MANQVVSVVTQKREGNLYFLYVNSVFQVDAETDVEYFKTISSLTEIVIMYKVKAGAGAATYIPKGRDEHLGGVIWHNLPESHKVTVELYQSDEETRYNYKSMDTRDAPILK